MTYTLPERIKRKVKINYVARKCKRLGVCDVSPEEIESNGCNPELLDKVVNALYLKQLGRLEEFERAENDSKVHYVTHAGWHPEGPLETGEIKSPLALFQDGMPMEKVKERTICARPRADVCFAIDTIGNYGPYVFAMPIEDVMQQDVKIGFDYELNGEHTIHVTHKDFDENDFLRHVEIAWGVEGNGEKEFEKIDKLKERIRSARENPKEFLMEMLVKGVPENTDSLVQPSSPYEGFNSPYTREALQPLQSIVKECTVEKGVVKDESEIPEKYWDGEKYLIISALETDEMGEVVERMENGFSEIYHEYIVFDKQKLLSMLEQVDEKTLEEVLSSYLKNTVYKNSYKEKIVRFRRSGNLPAVLSRAIRTLNLMGYDVGFGDKELSEIYKSLEEKSPEELERIKEEVFERLLKVKEEGRELEYIVKEKEVDRERKARTTATFEDYFYSTANDEGYSVEEMGVDDFLRVLDRTKERMESDRENYFKRCKPGRVKLTENTVFIAPEREKERWEEYIKKTGRKLKRFYYKERPEEFFEHVKTYDGQDFINEVKREVESERRNGKRFEINTEGLHKVALALMAKENGYITDFSVGIGFSNPMYEFDTKLFKYFNDAW